MIPNTQRPNEQYANFIFYLDGCVLNGLTPEEFLTLGVIYNYTGKGISGRTFDDAKSVTSVTKVHNQHKDKAKVTKNVTTSTWRRAVSTLTEKGWLYLVKTEGIPTSFKNVKIHNHYAFTDTALQTIKKAIKVKDGSVLAKSLF
jgi:hypothetical protein